jgi:N-formylglutamate amidohydrolase
MNEIDVYSYTVGFDGNLTKEQERIVEDFVLCMDRAEKSRKSLICDLLKDFSGGYTTEKYGRPLIVLR